MNHAAESQLVTSGPSKLKYVISISVILIGEVLLRDILLPRNSNDTYVAIAIGTEWLLATLLAFYWIPKVEGKKLSSIGFSPFHWRHIWLGSVVFIVQLIVTMAVGGAVQATNMGTLQDLQPKIKAYSLTTLVSLFTAGFWEELFYRGYLIERLISLTGKRWPALLVSWLSFTLIHLKFFGVGATIQVGVLSASLVLLYAKERSVWPCLVTHGINSVFAYALFPMYG